METTAPAFTISRSFKTSREKMFEVWSKAEHVARWWGPKDFTLTIHKFDLVTGGTFHYHLANAAGLEMWGLHTYLEVVAPERFVNVSGFSNAAGTLAHAPFSEHYPMQIQNTFTFTEADGQTTITLSSNPVNATPEQLAFYKGMNASMQQGMSGMFDNLEVYLAKI
jgi:uncharacterized protein YndB with AHSA1/START domain